MRNKIAGLTMVLALTPLAVSAQVSGSATGTATGRAAVPSGQVQAQATAKADVGFTVPANWSAEGKAKLEAMMRAAEREQLPREPMERRVAEGQAKGASEAAILAEVGRVKANLEAAHEVMVAAGRKSPSPEETERGARAMERGVARGQLELLVKHTPNDRSLVVAFDVLTRLTERGVPVNKALAQIQAKLDARASDAAILSLAGTANGAVAAGNSGRGGSVAGNAAGSATATATGGAAASGSAAATAAGTATGVTKGVTAGVTGTVTGVTKRP